MYVLATDDEQQSLERLIHILKEFLPTADIHGFKSSKEALRKNGSGNRANGWTWLLWRLKCRPCLALSWPQN